MTDPGQRLEQETTNENKDASKRKSPWEQYNMPPLSTAALMEIFDFNEQDLMSNRNHFATKAQRKVLSEELQNDADSMWQMLTILLIPTAVVAVIMVAQGLPMLYLVIGAGIMLGGMLAYAYRRQIGTRKDADNLRVRSAQGEIHISPAGLRVGEAAVHVGSEVFHVPGAQAKALTEYRSGMVRVYYAENSRQILSAEALQEVRADKLKVEDLQEGDPQADLMLEAQRIEDEEQRRNS